MALLGSDLEVADLDGGPGGAPGEDDLDGEGGPGAVSLVGDLDPEPAGVDEAAPMVSNATRRPPATSTRLTWSKVPGRLALTRRVAA